MEAPPESSGFGDLRVLVVDDEPEIALMLARLLKPAEVHSALNGFAALERLAAESFDLVLCDVVMPGLSGLEVLEELRGRAAPPRFVLMTGGATDEATRNALSASGVPGLYKPFGRRDVMKCVEATQFAGGVAER